MTPRHGAIGLIGLALAVSACTSSDNDAGPPEPTPLPSPATTPAPPPPTTQAPAPPPPTTQGPASGTLTATLQVGSAPLAGVEVFLGVNPPDGAGESRFACTDDNGVVTFTDVPFDASLISITGQGVSAQCANPLFLDTSTSPAYPLTPTTVLPANSSISADRDLGTVLVKRLPGSTALARESVAVHVSCLRDGDADAAFLHFDRYLDLVVIDRVSGVLSEADSVLIDANTESLRFPFSADEPCTVTGPVGEIPVLVDWTFTTEDDRPVVTLVDSGDEPRRVLAFTPEAGTRSDVAIRQVLSQTQAIDGVVTTDSTTTVDLALASEVVAVDADGNFTVLTTTRAARVRSDDGLTQDAVQAAVDEQIGATEATLLAPTGEVLAVESSLNTDFAQTLATSVSPLPTEPVGVGAVWTVETTFEALGAATDATTTYTITAIEGSLVSLEFETVQEIDLEALLANPALADAEVSLTQGGTGRTVWDLATGDTIESEFDLEQILIATAEFQGVESTLEQVILNSFEIPSPAAFSPPDGTEAFVVTEATHVDGSVDYDQDPPVGGPHSVDWVTCGYYDEPVSTEMAVHSMEHGAVWITYREGLAADEVAVLEAFDGMPYVLISPYPGLDSPVVASAWGVQLRLDSATDPRLAQFVDWFAAGPQTPEPGASC